VIDEQLHDLSFSKRGGNLQRCGFSVEASTVATLALATIATFGDIGANSPFSDAVTTVAARRIDEASDIWSCKDYDQQLVDPARAMPCCVGKHVLSGAGTLCQHYF
jgi:hypothetical protein